LLFGGMLNFLAAINFKLPGFFQQGKSLEMAGLFFIDKSRGYFARYFIVDIGFRVVFYITRQLNDIGFGMVLEVFGYNVYNQAPGTIIRIAGSPLQENTIYLY
jgi:hypothetical protein